MKNLLLLSIFALMFSSCTKIVGLVYGVKQPKLVSEKEILKTAGEWGLDSNTIYLPEKNYFLYDTNFAEKMRFPVVYIYDKNGVRLRNGQCGISLKKPDQFSFQSHQKDTLSANLFEKLQYYSPAVAPKAIESNEADYFITVNWATYGKGFYKRNSKQLAEFKASQKSSQIRTLFLNTDIRNSFFEDEDLKLSKSNTKD